MKARVLCVVLVAACSGRPAVTPVATANLVPFDSLTADRSAITLDSAPDGTQLGAVAGTLLRARDLVVLDASHSELRRFDRTTGKFLDRAGGPGDEPGDFRRPVAIVSVDSGRYMIFDQKRAVISLRDADGHVISESPVRGFLTGMTALRGENRVVLAGEVRDARGVASGTDIHELDVHGSTVASYGKSAPTESEWAFRFRALIVAESDGLVGTVSANANTLRIHDRATAAERVVPIAPGWLPPLEWPSDRSLRHAKSTGKVISDWAARQHLVNGLIGLGGGKFLVRFRAPAGGDHPQYEYIVIERDGSTSAITSPTNAYVTSAAGDTLHWINRAAGGSAVFATGVLRTNGSMK